jgi:mono/diheme cytochrome c family protein
MRHWILAIVAIAPLVSVPARAASGDSAPLPPEGEGRRLFLKLNCYGCHGMYASGGMGPSIVHAERGDVREAVMQGEDGGMPSFHQYVGDKDIRRLAAYLKSIGTDKEPVFKDWWIDIPPK